MKPEELEALVRKLVERHLSDEPGNVDVAKELPVAAGARGEGLKVVTEMEVRDAGLGGTVTAAPNAIVTAAARDLARAWGVSIQLGAPAPRRVRRIALGADHAGYEMKEEVKRLLDTLEATEVHDVGTRGKESVDYPDFAQAVAEAVSSGRCDLGIVVDGAGIGSAIAANKVPGIRAAMCYDAATARNSREHNFANVLTIGGRLISNETMKDIVRVFLETPTGEERHAARVRKILALEKKYLKTP